MKNLWWFVVYIYVINILFYLPGSSARAFNNLGDPLKTAPTVVVTLLGEFNKKYQSSSDFLELSNKLNLPLAKQRKIRKLLSQNDLTKVLLPKMTIQKRTMSFTDLPNLKVEFRGKTNFYLVVNDHEFFEVESIEKTLEFLSEVLSEKTSIKLNSLLFSLLLPEAKAQLVPIVGLAILVVLAGVMLTMVFKSITPKSIYNDLLEKEKSNELGCEPVPSDQKIGTSLESWRVKYLKSKSQRYTFEYENATKFNVKVDCYSGDKFEFCKQNALNYSIHAPTTTSKDKLSVFKITSIVYPHNLNPDKKQLAKIEGYRNKNYLTLFDEQDMNTSYLALSNMCNDPEVRQAVEKRKNIQINEKSSKSKS